MRWGKRARLFHKTFKALRRRWRQFCRTGDTAFLEKGVKAVGFALRNSGSFRESMGSSSEIEEIADTWSTKVDDMSTTASLVRVFYSGRHDRLSPGDALAHAFFKYHDRICGWRYLVLRELVRRNQSTP